TGCTVVLVDYRLAPEHRHPAQLEDSLAVLRWLRAHGAEIGVDPAHIIAAGDSAGGQMSAGMALWLRDHREAQVDAMVAIYPVFGNDTDTASAIRNADAPCLTRDEMIYFIASFLGPKGGPNWSDPYAAPLLGDLSGLPPAFIAVAAHDPLYDDGIAFHDRMIAAGNRSQLRVEPALAHSYMRARHHSAPAMEGFLAIVAAIARFSRGE
ncbi:MAG: alpha/beta hydrolase, partial [Rhizobiaceae bacterium]